MLDIDQLHEAKIWTAANKTPAADDTAPAERPLEQSSNSSFAQPADVASSSSGAPSPSSTKESRADLRMSELCEWAIEIKKLSGSWGASAERNARVISEIFIALNGDLRMSEIQRKHLLALHERLAKMPPIWGKSRDDREGGMQAVFRRGDALAAEWERDPIAAERLKRPKVGLSIPTLTRHINMLKEMFDLVGSQEDEAGAPTHIRPLVSFANLTKKDKRAKNKKKLMPTEAEVRALTSGPIYTGCLDVNDRFTPGDQVIHDGTYWVPLLLTTYGNRSNEFCQMPIRNVVEDAEIPFFRILESMHQNTKTRRSDRDLPIAPKLVELGFTEYVRQMKALGHFWLFPEFNRTKVPPRKVFRDKVFVELLHHHFPDGTSQKFIDKEIDTQSLRKFAASFLRKGEPAIQESIRQYFFGHERVQTTQGTYEDDPSLEELLPAVTKMQRLIAGVKAFPLNLRSDLTNP